MKELVIVMLHVTVDMHGNHLIHLLHYCSKTCTTTFRAEPIATRKNPNDLPSDSVPNDCNSKADFDELGDNLSESQVMVILVEKSRQLQI